MRINYLILLCVFVCVLSFSCFAQPQININYPINQTTFNISVRMQEQSPIMSIKLKNTGIYHIYNLTMSSTPFISYKNSIDELRVGDEKYLNYTVLTDDFFERDVYTTVSYTYLIPYDASNEVREVNITQTAINPFSPKIYRNKTTVRWFNRDSISHRIESLTGPDVFAFDLQPGQSYDRAFSSIGVETYFDKTTGQGGELRIISETLYTPVHNPAYDARINFHIKSDYRLTNVGLEVFTTNFSIDYDEQGHGVLQLKNNLIVTAMNVRLSMPWATFSPNYLNLSPLDSEIVNFYVQPVINSTNQTGKNYDYVMILSGDNVEQVQKYINLYVKYHSFEVNESEGCIDWDAKIKFCRENPSSQFCMSTPQVITEVRTEYKYPENLINITQPKFEDLLQTCVAVKNTPLRVENKFNDISDLNNNILGEINSLKAEIGNYTNQTVSLQNDYQNHIRNERIWSIIKGILWFLLASALIAFYLFRDFLKVKGFDN